MMRRFALLMVALAALLLTACGDDNQYDAQQGVQSFVSMMSAEVSPMSSSANTTVTADMTMDWAERTFPELFPRETAVLFPAIQYEGVMYNARAYVGAWETSYLGITEDRRIFGLGAFTGGVLQQFETIDYWADQVRADQITGTVTSLTGRVWMDRNLGASRVATAFDDSAAYGVLYQWGRGTDGHEKRTSPTTTTLSSSDTPGHGSFIRTSSSPYDWLNLQNNNLWQGVSGVNNPCPSGFRMPTDAEWQAEIATWSSNDQAGAFASPLKLVSAGYRDDRTVAVVDAGSRGGYWSSSVDGDHARGVGFYSGHANTYVIDRAVGFSARCLED